MREGAKKGRREEGKEGMTEGDEAGLVVKRLGK